MPDRLIREGICTSSRLGNVSERAEMLFVRLIVKACPLGRYHAKPDIVKAQALTNRPRIRVTDVALALDELERAGLIVRYTGPAPDNEPLLAIPKYGQRFTQKVRSPFPPPPEGPGDTPGQQYLFGDPPPEVIHNPLPPPDFSRPVRKERRKEESPQPPAAAGGRNYEAVEARKEARRYRSAQRAGDELREVETELTDILHPGGSAWKVTPTGAKLERYTVLMARRAELLRMVATEERRAS